MSSFQSLKKKKIKQKRHSEKIKFHSKEHEQSGKTAVLVVLLLENSFFRMPCLLTF